MEVLHARVSKANVVSNPMLKDVRPLRLHEDIIVFYRGSHTYNPQSWEKKHMKHRKLLDQTVNLREPTSILPVFPREKNNPNSTAKPVGTMEWLVQTYTDEYDTVLDNTMGSGTTGVAAANTHRNFVGIEMEAEMFQFAEHRIAKAYKRVLLEELEDDADAFDGTTIELPERQPRFDAKDYMKFYETVSKLSDYEEMVSWIVKYINQYFCVVQGDTYEIIEFVYGEFEEPKFCTPAMTKEKAKVKWALSHTTRKPAEMKLRFRKCPFYNEQDKKTDLFDVWSRSPDAREYSGRVFDPTRSISPDDTDTLNTFTGLKAEQEVVLDQHNISMGVNVEDLGIILLHIKNLCGGNDRYYEYLLDWLAFPIQTGQKTNVAVISHGGQGCGKSRFFVDFMGDEIYGKHLHAKIAGGKTQISGDFNAHISGNMYLAIEEPNDFTKGQLNKLKDMITSGTSEVHSKGKDQVFVEDYTNYVFTCNKIPEDMLEADDRRYFIIQHVGELPTHDFLVELISCMEMQAHEFYKFLKMREIKHFVLGQKPPQTEVKKRLLTLSIDPIFKYLQHLADTDALANYYKRPSDNRPVLPWKAFVPNAIEWCEREFESMTWKRKPLDLKELLKTKLGDTDACFEGTPVTFADYATGGTRSDRCILFPKTSDALIDLLIKNHVYTDLNDTTFDIEGSGTELDDYENLLDMEAKKSELVELDNMIRREQQLQNRDKFDAGGTDDDE